VTVVEISDCVEGIPSQPALVEKVSEHEPEDNEFHLELSTSDQQDGQHSVPSRHKIREKKAKI
jgi:hypothetical protein